MDEQSAVYSILLALVALVIGFIVYAWMKSAQIPEIVAAPIGFYSFLALLAAFFGIGGVVIAIVKAVSKALE